MPLAFIGGGTSLTPTGMVKNATGTTSWATAGQGWIAITGWTPNTSTYPGSTVVSDRLVVQGDKNATLTARVEFSGGFLAAAHQIRLVDQLGNTIGSSDPVTADSGTCAITATGVNLSSITSIGVQMHSNGNAPGSVAVESTYLTIT